jgi:hypothetical protein
MLDVLALQTTQEPETEDSDTALPRSGISVICQPD